MEARLEDTKVIKLEASAAKALLVILEDYVLWKKEGIEEAHMGEEAGHELTHHRTYAEYISHLEMQKDGAAYLLENIQEQVSIKVVSDAELAKL